MCLITLKCNFKKSKTPVGLPHYKLCCILGVNSFEGHGHKPERISLLQSVYTH